MAIITQALLEARIGPAELIRLTDDGATGALDVTVMNQIIAEGEGEILGDLAQRYTTPLALADSDTRLTVIGKLLDVIVFRLYVHRDREAEETATLLYRQAIAWAEKVGKGALGLVGETALTAAPASGGRIHTATSPALFGRDDMAGL